MRKLPVCLCVLALIVCANAFAQMPSIDQFWFHKNINSFDTGLQRMTFPPAEGGEVLVSVIGSGVDRAHPFLQDVFSRKAEWDFSRADGQANISDESGEGTHSIGVIGSFAKYSPSSLFKKIKVLPLKVSRSKGPRFESQMISAIDYSLSMGARVVLISHWWGEDESTPALASAIDRLSKSGIVIVAAGGDFAHSSAPYPCLYSAVICVGAAGKDGQPSKFSNKNYSVDFLAPGVGILSSVPSSMKVTSGLKGYDFRDGSRPAAAIIAAYAASLISLYSRLNPDDIYHRLALAAKDRPTTAAINGFPVFEKTFLPPSKDLPLVSLKSTSRFQVRGGVLGLKFDVLNLGAHENRVVLDYENVSPGYKIQKTREVLSFSAGEKKLTVELPLVVLSPAADQRVSVTVKLSFFGAVKSSQLSGWATSVFTGSKLGELEQGTDTNIKVINGASGTYVASVDNRGLLNLYKTAPVFQKTGSIQLPAGQSLMLQTLRLIDLDDDKLEELFWMSESTSSLRTIYYSDLSLKLKLSGEYSATVPSFEKQFHAFPKFIFEGKAYKVPAFLSTGSVTPADVMSGDFSVIDPDRHIYWLEPRRDGGKIKFVTRTLTHERFREKALSGLTVNLNSHLDLMLITKRSDVLQIIGGVKDAEGVTQSGVSIEVAQLDVAPKVKSIGFDRPLDKNGLLFPVDGAKGITSDGDILFIAAPAPSRLSVFQITGMSGKVQKMNPVGDLDIGEADKFLDVPLTSKSEAGLDSWFRSERSLFLLSSDKTKDLFPLGQNDRVEVVRGKSNASLIVSRGRGISLLKKDAGKISAPLKWSLYPEGCRYVGTDQVSIFFACPQSQVTGIFKLPLE